MRLINLVRLGLISTILLSSWPGGLSRAQTAPRNTQPAGAQNSSPPDEPLHRGGFVPGQNRKAEDPAQVARGKLLFGINCRGCHGADLRGGDLGGPNLLRSQVALSDLNGELIIPIIHGSRQNMGMPAIPLKEADAAAVAAYVRSVIQSIQVQGAPPSGKEPPSILVGDAAKGKVYFGDKCGRCHSITGDLSHVGMRFKDPKKLQDAWLAGGTQEEFQQHNGNASRRAVTVKISMPSGDTIEGTLKRVDEFLVTVSLADGSVRTIRRNGDTPIVNINDPLKIHRDLLSQYLDSDIHNITAYLAGVK